MSSFLVRFAGIVGATALLVGVTPSAAAETITDRFDITPQTVTVGQSVHVNVAVQSRFHMSDDGDNVIAGRVHCKDTISTVRSDGQVVHQGTLQTTSALSQQDPTLGTASYVVPSQALQQEGTYTVRVTCYDPQDQAMEHPLTEERTFTVQAHSGTEDATFSLSQTQVPSAVTATINVAWNVPGAQSCALSVRNSDAIAITTGDRATAEPYSGLTPSQRDDFTQNWHFVAPVGAGQFSLPPLKNAVARLVCADSDASTSLVAVGDHRGVALYDHTITVTRTAAPSEQGGGATPQPHIVGFATGANTGTHALGEAAFIAVDPGTRTDCAVEVVQPDGSVHTEDALAVPQKTNLLAIGGWLLAAGTNTLQLRCGDDVFPSEHTIVVGEPYLKVTGVTTVDGTHTVPVGGAFTVTWQAPQAQTCYVKVRNPHMNDFTPWFTRATQGQQQIAVDAEGEYIYRVGCHTKKVQGRWYGYTGQITVRGVSAETANGGNGTQGAGGSDDTGQGSGDAGNAADDSGGGDSDNANGATGGDGSGTADGSMSVTFTAPADAQRGEQILVHVDVARADGTRPRCYVTADPKVVSMHDATAAAPSELVADATVTAPMDLTVAVPTTLAADVTAVTLRLACEDADGNEQAVAQRTVAIAAPFAQIARADGTPLSVVDGTPPRTLVPAGSSLSVAWNAPRTDVEADGAGCYVRLGSSGDWTGPIRERVGQAVVAIPATMTPGTQTQLFVGCHKVKRGDQWVQYYMSFPLTIIAADGSGGDDGETGGSDTGDGSGGNLGDDAVVPLISSMTVTPAAAKHDESVTVTWTVQESAWRARGAKALRCTLTGTQEDMVRELNAALYLHTFTATRTVALAPFSDGILTLTLQCSGVDATGATMSDVRAQSTVTVTVGEAYGIRRFTADNYHLAEPGYVTLSWDFYGMRACSVQRQGLEGESLWFRAADYARSLDWHFSKNEERYYVSKTTQFTLTCTPDQDGAADVVKTLTVAVGQYTADMPVEGSEGAQYVRYCPFSIDNTVDRLVAFTQRIGWPGQKDVVNDVDIPAGRYRIWLTSGDSYAGRAGTDQPQERYYAVFYDADGEVVATTAPTEDLTETTASGRVTLVGDDVLFPRRAVRVEAVHVADGEGSVNPGCALLKRIGDVPAEGDAQGQASSGAAADTTAGDATTTTTSAGDAGTAGAGADGSAGATASGANGEGSTTTTTSNGTPADPAAGAGTVGGADATFTTSCDAPWENIVDTTLFAQPQDVFSGTTLVSVLCDRSVHIGQPGSEYYIWKTAYATPNATEPLNLRPLAVQGTQTVGDWIVGEGTFTLPADFPANSVGYVAVYVCKKDAMGTWHCGCRSSGSCSDPAAGQFYWNLRAFTLQP